MNNRVIVTTLLLAFIAACTPVLAPASTSAPPSVNVKPILLNTTDEPNHLNLYEIFPAETGQNLVFDNCLGCHSIRFIVLGQKTHDQWEGVKTRHVGWVSALNEDQLKLLFLYLEQNFNPTKPEPHLPQWYLELMIGTESEHP